jgi:hypothetical protein
MRIRALFAALLACCVLGALAVPASAATPRANTQKFCKAIKSVQGQLKSSASDPTSLGKNTLRKFASGVKAAGKQAPANVKKAANSLASFYSGLANQDASAIANAKNLGTSLTTFFTYVETNCGSS